MKWRVAIDSEHRTSLTGGSRTCALVPVSAQTLAILQVFRGFLSLSPQANVEMVSVSRLRVFTSN